MWAVVYVPAGGRADRYRDECLALCGRAGLGVARVTHDPDQVAALLRDGTADRVVVARDAHLRDLIPEAVVAARIPRQQQGLVVAVGAAALAPLVWLTRRALEHRTAAAMAVAAAIAAAALPVILDGGGREPPPPVVAERPAAVPPPAVPAPTSSPGPTRPPEPDPGPAAWIPANPTALHAPPPSVPRDLVPLPGLPLSPPIEVTVSPLPLPPTDDPCLDLELPRVHLTVCGG